MKSRLSYLKKTDLHKQLDSLAQKDFFAVIDQQVKAHLPTWIQSSPRVLWLTHPEDQKNLSQHAGAIEFFLKAGIHRQARLVVIGGGATTDFGGFVAATILRGIGWKAIPTTLLAMIDASIGGKVGVNMPQGKNLVGSFHAPDEILVCADFLTTLPASELASGKGELLKYGFLSKDIHQLILKSVPMEELIQACAQFKAQLVEKDFREQGDRILLNLGHTLGHAFESCLRIPHGSAVAMGMKYLFLVMGLKQPLEQWERMIAALGLKAENYQLSSYPHFKTEPFLSYLEQDKKKVHNDVRLVVVNDIGSCSIVTMPLKEFQTKVQSYHEFKR